MELSTSHPHWESEHGQQTWLDRYIPESVTHEVRVRCGFGCVVCGEAIFEYDHFDPVFTEAKAHVASGIALLCPTHHRAKEAGLLSNRKYRDAIADPFAVRAGGAFAGWEEGEFAPQIECGNLTFEGGTSILRVDGTLVLGFDPPEVASGPARLNVRFHNRDGNPVFAIVSNVVEIPSEAFDVKASGRQIRVRSGRYKVDLVIDLYLPARIVVSKLVLRYGRWGLSVDESAFKLTRDGQEVGGFLGGRAIVYGPILFDCDSDANKVMMNNLTINGTGPRTRPYSSEVREMADGRIFFPWPLYVATTAQGNTPSAEIKLGIINGTSFLPLFTSEELALAGGPLPAGFRLVGLNVKGLTKLLATVGAREGVTHVVLDPDMKTKEHAWNPQPVEHFITDVSVNDAEDVDGMLKNREESVFGSELGREASP